MRVIFTATGDAASVPRSVAERLIAAGIAKPLKQKRYTAVRPRGEKAIKE